MDYNEVNSLIEKYFLAETSLEEERLLRDYFAGGDVPTALKVYSPLFKTEVADELNAGFDERILSLIGEEKPVEKSARVRNIFPGWLRIAAIFLLVLGGSIVLYNNYNADKAGYHPDVVQTTKGPYQIEDTYTDPEQARQELEKALALLSSKMNQVNEATAEQVGRLEVISKVIPESN